MAHHLTEKMTHLEITEPAREATVVRPSSSSVLAVVAGTLTWAVLLLAPPAWCQQRRAGAAEDRAGFDTFFEDREYFKHFEIGWIPSYENRFTDNVHLAAWHADARASAETPEGWGLNFSLARTLGERLLPFLRMGWAHGGLTALEETVASGLGVEFSQGDQLGVGASWGRPAEGSIAVYSLRAGISL